MEKLLITGTGRCGTTFLIKLLSFLGFDTGYTRENYMSSISSNCNSGMERAHTDTPYIVKNPLFMMQIDDLVADASIKIKYVILPIRDFALSAQSRVRHGAQNGGLWNAVDEDSQVAFYAATLANYVRVSTKHDIQTIFIDFDRMVETASYLYAKLKPILDEKDIDVNEFARVYEEASLTSRPSPAKDDP